MKSSAEVNIFGGMSLCEEYFPTRAYTNAVSRLGQLLSKERDRLDSVAQSLGRKSAIGPDNLAVQVPMIVDFAKEYHRAYSLYLEAVLPQHKNGIKCGPSCGNCCHHYPMSVEPFELVYLYSSLRHRDDFLSIMEDCQIRAKLFEGLLGKRLAESDSEDDADDNLTRSHALFKGGDPAAGLSMVLVAVAASLGVIVVAALARSFCLLGGVLVGTTAGGSDKGLDILSLLIGVRIDTLADVGRESLLFLDKLFESFVISHGIHLLPHLSCGALSYICLP